MSNDSLLSSVMDSFREQLGKEADNALQEYVKTYKSQLCRVQQTNEKEMNTTIANYHQKRKDLSAKLDDKVDKMIIGVEKTISSKIADAASKMDEKIDNIDDELFNDPNRLYQKIVNAAKDLQKKRDEFAQERKRWNQDDVRCAEWLGISYQNEPVDRKNDDEEDVKGVGLDDEEVNYHGNDANKEKISDEDFVTIKVDDRVFKTYRGTLTQIKGSFIQKLFGPHHHMIHRDSDGAYYLNRNPDTFAGVLDILRKRGAVATDFKITPTLYAALVEYGILKAFFPSFQLSELSIGCDEKKKGDYHVVFQSFRSTANNGNYLRWNVDHLSNTTLEHWKLNTNDNSEIQFLKTGYYRIVFRCCVNYSSAAYVRMEVDGSATEYSYHYNNSSNHYKSHNFNDIIQFTEGQKLKLYASTAAYSEEKASYLCIERIPDAILNGIGIWTSTAVSSNYRVWNSTIKASDRCTPSSYNMQIQKGGLYRISSRTHTNYTSAGQRNMRMYEYRNGGGHSLYNSQSSNSTGNECHMIDTMISFRKNDYFNLHFGGYGTVNNAQYQRLQIEYVPFARMIGHWRSHANKNTNIRVWNYEYWCNDMLYQLNEDQTKLEVREEGNYRISAMLNNNQPSGNGYSALYVNDQQYCLSRMGCYNGTWYHTTSIQEILQLKAGDKLHFYSTACYNTYQYNSFFIEKVL
eukprot:191570_1